MTNIHHDDSTAARLERGRRGAKRTAWLFAGIAVAVYVGFMLLGVFGK